jgi:regulator-associated protein of mTOR
VCPFSFSFSFLQSYTQYIPLPLNDLDSWLKTPSIYVFDCSGAGKVVNAFIEVFIQNHVYWMLYTKTSIYRFWFVIFFFLFALLNFVAGLVIDKLHEWSASNSNGSPRDCIMLAACEAHETLPQSVEFPADVFTACLTTPIKMALRWWIFSH